MKQPMKSFDSPSRQAGMLTIFASVLVLFLMTVMLIYASRTTVFDQRVSGNEQRYRVAFNLAEAASAVTLETIEAAGTAVLSSTGWRNGTWQPCSDAVDVCTADLPDPTFAVPGWYIQDLGASIDEFALAIADITGNQPDATARVSLAMQFINPGGIAEDPPEPGEEFDSRAVFMVYGYGYSDCTDVTDIDTCQGRASIAQPLGTYRNLAGAPPVPLTSKSDVEISGSATLVGNPDAGGVGVMATVWSNNRPGWDGVIETAGQGTWQTCQLGDWYDTEDVPAGYSCPIQGANGCSCDGVELISSGEGGSAVLELDIMQDDEFPEDLFQVFFGIQETQYRLIKDAAIELEDCSSLDENSSGLYWVTGNCSFTQNGLQVGSPENPVTVVVAGDGDIKMNSGEFFGVLFVTDVEAREAANWPAEQPDDEYTTFDIQGNFTFFGAIIVDTHLEEINGTFDLVYAEGVLARAAGIGGVAAVDGGWRDFDVPAGP